MRDYEEIADLLDVSYGCNRFVTFFDWLVNVPREFLNLEKDVFHKAKSRADFENPDYLVYLTSQGGIFKITAKTGMDPETRWGSQLRFMWKNSEFMDNLSLEIGNINNIIYDGEIIKSDIQVIEARSACKKTYDGTDEVGSATRLSFPDQELKVDPFNQWSKVYALFNAIEHYHQVLHTSKEYRYMFYNNIWSIKKSEKLGDFDLRTDFRGRISFLGESVESTFKELNNVLLDGKNLNQDISDYRNKIFASEVYKNLRKLYDKSPKGQAELQEIRRKLLKR